MAQTILFSFLIVALVVIIPVVGNALTPTNLRGWYIKNTLIVAAIAGGIALVIIWIASFLG